ncbi:hypothetical protein QIH93_08150 [Bradyrhizobium ottawaense]|uniref:hypothetical protein n=1 Tax=Bradyrhizobium ottawaense TaxID=931866 RepID=UPI002715429F|nr:hypothetical protein [Bradyrhizobium ottawaense]WLB47932.1 hypothetical protein QIH93_08150 [Bradyrhizobium ottawaense]
MIVRILLLAAGFLVSVTSIGYGQSSTPSAGLTMQGAADFGGNIIKDGLGRPCLDVEAAARPATINPDMREHIVSIKNNCLRPIKVKVCYYGSDQCRQLDVQGYKRADTILGVMRGIKFFRYTLFQK